MPRVTIWDDAWGSGSPVVVSNDDSPALSATTTHRVPGMNWSGPAPANATVRLGGLGDSYINTAKPRQMIQIEDVVNHAADVVFLGLTLGPTPRNFPRVNEIQASGFLSMAQQPIFSARKYFNMGNDGPIISNLLALAGVPYHSVNGSNLVMYTAPGNVLSIPSGTSPLDEIGRLCSVTLRPIYDTRDGTVRYGRSMVGIYASEYSYVQGNPGANQLPAWNWSRPQVYGSSANLIRALGYLSNDPKRRRPSAGAKDTSTHWAPQTPDNPDGLVAKTIQADGLDANVETFSGSGVDVDCFTVASAWCAFLNRVPDVIQFTAGPNSGLDPMVCIDVTASRLGINSASQYMVLSVQRNMSTISTVTVTALSTALGNSGAQHSLLPVPSFGWRVTRAPDPDGTQTDNVFHVQGNDSHDADDTNNANLTPTWSTRWGPPFDSLFANAAIRGAVIDPTDPWSYTVTVVDSASGILWSSSPLVQFNPEVILTVTNGDKLTATLVQQL